MWRLSLAKTTPLKSDTEYLLSVKVLQRQLILVKHNLYFVSYNKHEVHPHWISPDSMSGYAITCFSHCTLFFSLLHIVAQILLLIMCNFCRSLQQLQQPTLQSESELHYNWQWVSKSWCRAQIGTFDQTSFFFFFFFCFLFESYCPVIWREVGSVIYQSLSIQSRVVSQYLHKLFIYSLC
jgi:hypothetical protein